MVGLFSRDDYPLSISSTLVGVMVFNNEDIDVWESESDKMTVSRRKGSPTFPADCERGEDHMWPMEDRTLVCRLYIYYQEILDYKYYKLTVSAEKLVDNLWFM